MPDLKFEVIGAEVPLFAAVPTILFKLRITQESTQQHIHSVMLRTQVQIAATRRRYSARAQEHLLDVFGEPQRWGETLRSLLWAHVSISVPAFSESIVVDLPITCTYDFEVVRTKYFAALEDGDIPLTFLFSGSVFYANDAGMLQVVQVPWSKEATFRLPVATWQQMIAHYFPDIAWLRVSKDVFEQVYLYKARHGLPTLEDALTQLLRAGSEEVQR